MAFQVGDRGGGEILTADQMPVIGRQKARPQHGGRPGATVIPAVRALATTRR
jgi:hypothetical protein